MIVRALWLDKSRREVDFVVRRGRDRLDLLECRIDPDRLNVAAVQAFRNLYPLGDNYIVSPAAKRSYRVRRGDWVFKVCTTGELPARTS